jgi:acyl carrier protein
MDPKLRERIERRERILARVRRVLVEDLKVRREPEQIDPDTPLFGTGLGLDSVDAIELVVALETHLGTSMPDSQSTRKWMRTVNTVVQYVLDHEKGPPK